MLRLTMVLISIVSTVLMGVGVTVVLAMGLPGWKPIAMAAAAGAVLSLPIAMLVARRMLAPGR